MIYLTRVSTLHVSHVIHSVRADIQTMQPDNGCNTYYIDGESEIEAME